MKKTRAAALLLICACGPLSLAAAAAEPADPWRVPRPQPFDAGRLAKSPDFIRVVGNRFVGEGG